MFDRCTVFCNYISETEYKMLIIVIYTVVNSASLNEEYNVACSLHSIVK